MSNTQYSGEFFIDYFDDQPCHGSSTFGSICVFSKTGYKQKCGIYALPHTVSRPGTACVSQPKLCRGVRSVGYGKEDGGGSTVGCMVHWRRG